MNTTLRQDLEAIASEMTGDRTPAGIATIALDKLADTQDELAALKAENERLRAALDSVYRKANSMADYYPEPGTERNAYVSDAPEVFNDIRDTALKALQPK